MKLSSVLCNLLPLATAVQAYIKTKSTIYFWSIPMHELLTEATTGITL
jgi:hypothetical protein